MNLPFRSSNRCARMRLRGQPLTAHGLRLRAGGLLPAAILFSLVALCGCGPTWYLDVNYAQKLAKKENRPLLYYFKNWDSPQHRDMKLRVFEHAQVQKEMMDTVNVELEFAWARDDAHRLGVQRTQVCVMCSSQGDKVYTALAVNPVPTEKEFLEWLVRAKAEAKARLPVSPSTRPTTQPAK